MPSFFHMHIVKSSFPPVHSVTSVFFYEAGNKNPPKNKKMGRRKQYSWKPSSLIVRVIIWKQIERQVFGFGGWGGLVWGFSGGCLGLFFILVIVRDMECSSPYSDHYAFSVSVKVICNNLLYHYVDFSISLSFQFSISHLITTQYI